VEELWRVAEEVEQPTGGSVRIWDFLTHQGPAGVSPAIQRVSGQIRQAAQGELPVLILGETGVGKEVTARAIHDLSSRSGEPFIIVHTPAITESLFESTLFGHRRGAFTGATEHRQGLVEMAGNGTLFFDEISETTPAVQAKLLRFLDSREYFVVGGPRIRVSGARILAASNQPYGHLLTSRNFRSDLLHRIAGMMIEIPPLRDRIEDLPVLLENWLRQLNAERGRHKIIHRDTFSFLRGYSFPGNVRELQHLFREAWERANSSIQPHHFSRTRMAAALQTENVNGEFPGLPLRKALEGFERDYIRRALQHTRFDKTRTSELLRVSRQTLYNKLRQLGLQE
jgi:DNA-binding NtrC family response regulator